MLEKAIKYIVGLATPTVQTINNEIYSDKQLYRVAHNPKASTIRLNTLSSLVAYIKSGVDDMRSERMIVHIQSPTKVALYSALDYDREREYLVEVNAQIPSFDFNTFINHESFCINLQSKFVDSPDRALLLKFAGTVEAGSVAEYGDDGVSQKATVKTGIASKGDALVPSPVTLKPYRTFIEVDQPLSDFIFRMKQSGCNDIACALYEADGGAWKKAAMNNIANYLDEALKDYPDFIIIN